NLVRQNKNSTLAFVWRYRFGAFDRVCECRKPAPGASGQEAPGGRAPVSSGRLALANRATTFDREYYPQLARCDWRSVFGAVGNAASAEVGSGRDSALERHPFRSHDFVFCSWYNHCDGAVDRTVAGGGDFTSGSPRRAAAIVPHCEGRVAKPHSRPACIVTSLSGFRSHSRFWPTVEELRTSF